MKTQIPATAKLEMKGCLNMPQPMRAKWKNMLCLQVTFAPFTIRLSTTQKIARPARNKLTSIQVIQTDLRMDTTFFEANRAFTNGRCSTTKESHIAKGTKPRDLLPSS